MKIFVLTVARYDWHDQALFSSLEAAMKAGTQAMIRFCDGDGEVPEWSYSETLESWQLECGDNELAVSQLTLDSDPEWFPNS